MDNYQCGSGGERRTKRKRKKEEREEAAETTYKTHNSEGAQNAPIVTMGTSLQLYCIIPGKGKGEEEKTDVRTHQSQQKIGTVMHDIHEQKKGNSNKKTDTKRTIPKQ